MLKKSSMLVFVFLLVAVLPCVAFAYTTGDDYPIEYANPPRDSFVECWNFWNRECTSFAAWCLNSRNGIEFSNQYNIRADGSIGGYAQWGHAWHWGHQAKELGYTVDRNPAVGSIYWRESGDYGHVAWVSGVEQTEDDVHVWVEEYNAIVPGGFAAFDFYLSNSSYAEIRFIHIADIGTPVISQYSQPLDGEFYIRSRVSSDRTQGYLSTDGNADSWGANIGISPYDGQKCLRLSTVQLDNIANGIMIRPSYSDLAFGSMGYLVNANGRRVFDSANVQLYGNDAYSSLFGGQWFSASKWILEKSGGFYIIRNKNNPNRVLTVEGSNVLLRVYTGDANQLWEILPGNEDPTKDVIFGINYYLNSGRTYDNPLDATSEQIANEHKRRFEDYTIRTEIPERRGYSFLGWSTDENAAEPDERYAPGSLYTIDAPLNLWAIWKNLSEGENGAITFGHWEQDGDNSNGPEPITWHVLYSEGEAQYIITDKVLSIRPFGGGLQNWERSSLRSWLNGDFYNAAFTTEEKAYIMKRDQLNLGNDFWVASDDRGTSDYIFLPSQRELLRFLPEDSTRRAKASTLAINEAGLPSDTEYVSWWIRTNGVFIGQAMQVNRDGSINTDGVYGGDKAGIRPVIWLSGRPNSDDAGGGGGGTSWDISDIPDETYEPANTITPMPTMEPLPTIADTFATATPEPVIQPTNTPSSVTTSPTSTPTPTSPTFTPSASVFDAWQDAYRTFVLDKEYERVGYPDYLLDGYDTVAMTDGSVRLEYVGYDYDPIWFSLYDLDNDQIPELLAFNGMGYMAGNFCHVYTFKNHSMAHIGELGRRELMLSYSFDKRFPGLIQTDGNMGYYTTDYWYIQNGEIRCETIENIHDGPYLEEEEFAGNNGEAVVTRETNNNDLYDWYCNSSFDLLPHWEYSEISEKGWDRFVSAMLQPQAQQTVTNTEVPQNVSDGEPSELYTWETAMNFEDVLLDSNTYDGSWPEAYLSILRSNEVNIRNYEGQIEEMAPYLDGQPLRILFQDINGDGTPEMFLLSDIWAEQGMWGYCDLYVYSHDGTLAKCILSIPEIYKEVEAGASYSIFMDNTAPGIFNVQYYDGWGVWQVRYDVMNHFQRLDALRGIYRKVSDEYEEDTYYLNGAEISYQEFQSQWLPVNTSTVTLLGSTDYSPASSGMRYDAAIQYLTSLLSASGDNNQDNGLTLGLVDFDVANEDVLCVSEGYYHTDNYNTDEYFSFIPVDVFCNKEIYTANNPITFSADILGGTPPFTVHWFVEESQVRDGPTPLDLYMEAHDDYSSSISYKTNCRHVEYVYTPPVESTTLFGCFSVTDSQGISNYSPNEDLASVDTIAEWRALFPTVRYPKDETFPFVARTSKKNVNVRNGVGMDQDKITTLSKAGTLVKVIGKRYDSSGKKWYIVRLSIDQVGCIRSDLLTAE